MTENSESIATLDSEQCWQRLRTQDLGRIVTHVGDVIDIFPVNYAVDGGAIVFRTAPGSKLFELTVNEHVLFEVDDHDDSRAWSVIVRGDAAVIETDAERQRAEAAGLRPWTPTMKRVFVRISPTSLTGRSFERGPEPDRFGVAEY